MAVEMPSSVSRTLPILVVDDVPSARRIVIRMLATLGFKNVTEVSSVTEAMKSLGGDSFGLVISDLHLKDAKATDLITQARALPNHGKTPFVVITSDMDKESFAEALEKGASSYLLKPFSPTALVEKLMQVLGS